MYQVLRITRMSLALAWAPRPWYKSWPLSFPTCLFIIRLLKNITQNDLTLSSWLGFRNWIKKIGTAIAHGFCAWINNHDLLVHGVSVWSHFKTTLFPKRSCDWVMSKNAGVLMMRTPGDWKYENVGENPHLNLAWISPRFFLPCMIQCISTQLTGNTWCKGNIVRLASQAVMFERRHISPKHLAGV